MTGKQQREPVAPAGDKPEREDMLRDMRDPGWRQRKEEIDRASARARFNQAFPAGDKPPPLEDDPTPPARYTSLLPASVDNGGDLW